MTTQVIPGTNVITVDPAGNVLFLVPHGTFYSLATQAIANVANVQVIAFELDTDVHMLTHSRVTDNSRVYVQSSGSYEVICSGIADLSAAPANKHLELWMRINGSDVADSNTIVEITTATVEMTVAVSFILDLTAGQYIELATWGDATTCEWLATAAAAGPTRPACPSMIMTVKKVSSYA